MIQASFSCFKGLGTSAEAKLWQYGCLSWNRLSFLPPKTLSESKLKQVKLEIIQARTALDAGWADYFLNRFQGSDKIRVFKEFQHQTAFIDIETTGLDRRDTITTIAVMTHGTLRVLVNGFDLDQFPRLLKDVKLLITFNGARFDLPFLRRHFNIDLGIPHLDLMLVLADLGYKGGQKKCETAMGLTRTCVPEQSGMHAPELWNRWQTTRNFNYLKKLIIYNAEDVFMLEKLAILAYKRTMSLMPVRVHLQSSQDSTDMNVNKIYSVAL